MTTRISAKRRPLCTRAKYTASRMPLLGFMSTIHLALSILHLLKELGHEAWPETQPDLNLGITHVGTSTKYQQKCCFFSWWTQHTDKNGTLTHSTSKSSKITIRSRSTGTSNSHSRSPTATTSSSAPSTSTKTSKCTASSHRPAPIQLSPRRASPSESSISRWPSLQNKDDKAYFWMQYYDDPRGNIPTAIINWAVSSALPKMLNDLHKACKNYPQDRLEKMKEKYFWPDETLRDFSCLMLNEN